MFSRAAERTGRYLEDAPWLLVVFVSFYAGRALANSPSPTILVAIALVLALGVATFAIGTEYALAALLVTAPIGLEQLTENKRSLLPAFGGFAISSLRIALLLAVVVALIATKGMPRRLTFPEKAYLTLVGWFALLLVISPSVFEGLRFTAKVAALPAAWIGFAWVIERFGADVVWRLFRWTFVGTLVADAALYVTGYEVHPGPFGPDRFAAVAGSPAAGALSLALLALVALYQWFENRDRLALFMYTVSWFFVFVSLTRIALVAFFAASCLIAVLMGRARDAAVITVILAAVTFSYAPLRERMAWGNAARSWSAIYQSYQEHGTANLNLEGRLVLWRPLWRDFEKHPFFGSGPGASAKVLKQAARDNPSPTSTSAVVSQAHSDYLAVLTNGGIAALALWLLGLIGLAVQFARTRGVACIAAAGILLYLITAITDNAIEMYATVGIPLGALIALAFAAQRTVDTAPRPDDPS